jgi:hypothetical protein
MPALSVPVFIRAFSSSPSAAFIKSLLPLFLRLLIGAFDTPRLLTSGLASV